MYSPFYNEFRLSIVYMSTYVRNPVIDLLYLNLLLTCTVCHFLERVMGKAFLKPQIRRLQWLLAVLRRS